MDKEQLNWFMTFLLAASFSVALWTVAQRLETIEDHVSRINKMVLTFHSLRR